MRLKERLRTNRRRIDAELAPSARHNLTPGFYAQHVIITPLLRRYARGDVIDLGCGTMPFREIIADQVCTYDSLDREARVEGVTYLGDIEDMAMVPSARYDAALCLEVLEHLPHPDRALHEMARILRPGGWLVLSVPHLSRLHEEPHDYYRFTTHALRMLLQEAGLEVETIIHKGGALSFLGHQVSTLLVASLWHVPVVRQVAWFVNKWLITRPCYYLDRLIDRSGTLALGYIAVARKPPVGPASGNAAVCHAHVMSGRAGDRDYQ